MGNMTSHTGERRTFQQPCMLKTGAIRSAHPCKSFGERDPAFSSGESRCMQHDLTTAACSLKRLWKRHLASNPANPVHGCLVCRYRGGSGGPGTGFMGNRVHVCESQAPLEPLHYAGVFVPPRDSTPYSITADFAICPVCMRGCTQSRSR
jgi:hypothetical protein